MSAPTPQEKEAHEALRKKVYEELKGKREIVVCGKISYDFSLVLNNYVGAGKKYKTMNDLVERVLLDKVFAIEWSKFRKGVN